MSHIKVLDKHIAELIAAGEVVERPASVIKELVENSIDAGSTSITVEIKNGGTTYIKVEDNGCGIERADVKTAFLRHATSKVSKSEDLDSIYTLGFRGEALPSIASVACVKLNTKAETETEGTLYVIAGGEEQTFEETGRANGTTIEVEDIFFNTPARMKFLKKDVTEGNAVADVIERLSLSHPEISFKFYRESKQVLFTPGDGKLISVIRAVYGKDIANGMIPVDYSNGALKVSGYVSKPANSRSNRSLQTFFVNGRYVKTGTGSAALGEAYKNSIMVGKFPMCVLNISLPYEMVDANVHPAKTEIRFFDERAVFSLVYYGAKNAITAGDTRPDASLNTQKTVNPFADKKEFFTKPDVKQTEFKGGPAIKMEQPEIVKTQTEKPKSDLSAFIHRASVFDKNNDENGDEIIPEKLNTEKLKSAENDFSNNAQKTKDSRIDISVEDEDETEKSDLQNNKNSQPRKPVALRLIGEAFKTYIIVETDGKIMVIDKHAAHERIIFNKLKKSTPDASSQQLLKPIRVRLSQKHYDAVVNDIDKLKTVGIDIDDYGDGDVLVRGVPLISKDEDITSFVEEIAENLVNHTALQSEHTDWVYHSVACRAAVKAGDTSSSEELFALAEQVCSDRDVMYCPHGRPVAFFITRNELERNFGRI